MFRFYSAKDGGIWCKFLTLLARPTILHKIIVKSIFKQFLYKTISFIKEGGRLKGGVVLKEGFYGSQN